MLSSSGLEMACCAASIARFSPRPMPVPMSAEPPLCITVRTSAKSTFTRPVTLMSDEMPCVACSRTSSAFLSASWNGIPLPTTASSRSFGTTIIVSTCLRISAMPCSAWRMRLRPSKRNGRVTMPTVSAPCSLRERADLRRRAGAGAAAHAAGDEDEVGAGDGLRHLVATLLDGLLAHLGARAGAEAARQLLPDLDLEVRLRLSSACASVLTEMNSTPSRCSSIMRLTALPPPPPTPTTFMRAFCAALSSNSKIIAYDTPLRRGVQWEKQEGATGRARRRQPPRREKRTPAARNDGAI